MMETKWYDQLADRMIDITDPYFGSLKLKDGSKLLTVGRHEACILEGAVSKLTGNQLLELVNVAGQSIHNPDEAATLILESLGINMVSYNPRRILLTGAQVALVIIMTNRAKVLQYAA